MSPASAPPSSARLLPWRVGDLFVVSIALMLGAAMLCVAWFGASGTRRWSQQLLWVDVGAVGVVIAGVGIALWLASGRRVVGQRRIALVPNLPGPAPEFTGATTDGAGRGANSLFVSAPPMTRYHRKDCPAVAGKSVKAASTAIHSAAGLQPCRICRSGE